MKSAIDSHPDELFPAGPFNCIIRAFAARGDHQDACKTLYTMRDANIEWNGGSIHASLNSVRACSHWQLAMLIFECKYRKTPATHEVLAEICSLAGRHREASTVLEELKRIRALSRHRAAISPSR